jgi:hypothetical protein
VGATLKVAVANPARADPEIPSINRNMKLRNHDILPFIKPADDNLIIVKMLSGKFLSILPGINEQFF